MTNDEELYHVPDTSSGAVTNCECSECREARLADYERIVFGPWDVARAYAEGWRDGFVRGLQRRSNIEIG